MNARITAVIGTAIFLSACSTSLKVSEISNSLPAGSEVNGIPFRIPKRTTMKIYELADKGGYRLVYSQPVTIADPKRLFLLGFESLPLANSTLDFKMNDDNTLSSVALKSESKGAEVLTEAGTQAAAVNTAITAKEAADKAAVTAAKGEVTASSTAAIAADKAYQAAELAQAQYDDLAKDSSAKPVDLLKAANAARSAKLDANEAARLAGKSPYYPDVVP